MFNRAIIIGRLVRDCEVKKTTQGTSVCNFGVAINEQLKAGQESTEFIDCTAWRQNADFLGQYGKKGMLIFVEGKVHKNTKTDKDGNKRYEQIVECRTVKSLEKRQPAEPYAEDFTDVVDDDFMQEGLPY